MAGSKTRGGKPLHNEPKKPPAGNSPAPKIPVESIVEELLTRLDAHVKQNEYSKVVKLADEILSHIPNDRDAIHCKVVALIQSGNLDEASGVVRSAEKSNLNFPLEKAYCLYRENKLEEALSVLNSVSNPLPDASPSPSTLSAALQLEAQIRYRMGDSEGCISCYEKLSKNGQVALPGESSTNLVAAYVAAGRGSEIPNLLKSLKLQPQESFDIAYNAACGLIQTEDYSSAEKMLLLAKRVGEEVLIEEEYSEAEIEDTLSPATVQLAYVLQMQGKTSEAQEAYGSYFRKKTNDISSSCVAINNSVALKAGKDSLDGLKKFEKILTVKKGTGSLNKFEFKENLEHKLSTKQKRIIYFNRFLLSLHANKLDDAKELLPSLKASFPEGDLTPLLLSVSLLLKENKIKEATQLMEQEDSLTNSESNKMQIDGSDEISEDRDILTKHLLHAHVYVLGNLFLEAARVLESVEKFKFKPSFVSIILSLKEQGGDEKGLEDYLDSTVSFFEQKIETEGKEGEKDAEMRHRLILLAAKHKYKRENHQEAAKLYEKILHSSSRTFPPSAAQKEEALLGLILCYSVYDLKSAERLEETLPPISGMTPSSLDTEALESSFSATPISSKTKRPPVPSATESKSDVIDEKKSKKKRKRKVIYPKGYDPANPGPPPDPERWLPKHERSSYRPKRKDKRGVVQVRGSQGAVSKDKSTVEKTSAPPSSSGPEKGKEKQTKPVAAPVEPPGGGRRKGRGKR